jgi:hypothetical protein
MCVSIFSTTFVWNISHSKKNWARYYHKRVSVFMKHNRYSCPILMKLEFSGQSFEKILWYQILWKSVKWETSCFIRTDMTKLIVSFRNFAYAPKNAKLSLSTPRRRRGGVDIQLRSFLISAHDGGEWSVSRPGLFTHAEVLRYPLSGKLVRGWVEPRAGLDV